MGLRNAEIQTFGIGHDAAAALVLGAWRFPEHFVSAVERHHDASAFASEFDHVVAAGNALAELATTYRPPTVLQFDDDEFEPAGFERTIELAALEHPGFEHAGLEHAGFEPEEPVPSAAAQASVGDAGREQHLDVLAAVGIDPTTVDELIALTARRAAEIAATLPGH
jgi:hypothetical protein